MTSKLTLPIREGNHLGADVVGDTDLFDTPDQRKLSRLEPERTLAIQLFHSEVDARVN